MEAAVVGETDTHRDREREREREKQSSKRKDEFQGRHNLQT